MQPLHYRCDDCNAVFPADQLLRADNPWSKDAEAVTGCPHCFTITNGTRLCDDPGCVREATCGWPTPSGGYRMTCGAHMQGATIIEHLEIDTIAAPPQGE